MTEQKTIEDVLVVLQGMQRHIEENMATKADISSLKTSVASLETSVSSLETSVSSLETSVSSLETSVASLKTDVSEVKGTIVALQDDLEFVKENMVTKVELAESESRMLTHIDGLTKEHIKLDHELVAGRARSERLEERVDLLELRMKIAA